MTHSDEGKIDRWHSEVLDVHTWSDHPEIKALCEKIYLDAGINHLDKPGNRKPKKSAKDCLRVLLLDLYVKWLKDPSLSIGFSKRAKSYKPGSRYNGLFIPRKIIDVEKCLYETGYIDELPHYFNRTGQGQSYITRIRHTEKLRSHFRQLTIDLHDIDTHKDEECIVLHEEYVPGDTDKNKDKKQVVVDYDDNDLTKQLRSQLQSYNSLLRHTFIDIPNFIKPIFNRLTKKGPRAGQTQVISLGPDNKFVRRVFNGGTEGNWELGGRFYGGWWQQIDKKLRPKIYINDHPTLEVDFNALHPNLLANETGDPLEDDPYDLGELLLPDVLTTPKIQRKYVKKLVLMAINSDDDKIAYAALRNSDRKDKLGQSLTNEQLAILLNKFVEKYPSLGDSLNTGQALRLMGIDGRIANLVLDHFTQKNIPVLCIHDSFIIQFDKEPELRRILDEATYQETRASLKHEIKNERIIHKQRVWGNIKGFEEPRIMEMFTPKRVNATSQYQARRDKFSRWLEQIV